MRRTLGVSGWMTRMTVFAWAMAIVQTSPLLGQAAFPSPVISSVFPAGGKAGSTVEISVKGTDLDGPRGLVFSPGATPALEALPKRDANGQVVTGTFTLQIPAQAKPGFYDVRFSGTYGVSNPRLFQIGAHDEVGSPNSNQKPEDAFAIALGTVINGRMTAGAPQWFSFEARKSQRVMIVGLGTSLDTKLEPAGAVQDPSGRELARMRDGVIDFKAPADGKFLLEFHDLMFRTGDEYGFRLSVALDPVILFAARECKAQGAEGRSVVYGWNLPGGQSLKDLHGFGSQPLERLVTDVANFERLTSASAQPPALLAVENEEPSISAGGPIEMQMGGRFGGWFPARGEPRSFQLALRKGQRCVIDVVSHRAGLPTDPTLLIEKISKDKDGRETAGTVAEITDLSAPVPSAMLPVSDRDPSYVLESREDAVYRLSLSDAFNTSNGRRYPFVIEIGNESTRPLVALPCSLPKAANARTASIGDTNVSRGGVVAVQVLCTHRSGLAGNIDWKPAPVIPGLTFLGGFLGENQSVGYAAYQAAPDAAPGVAPASQFPSATVLSWNVADSNKEPIVVRPASGLAIGIASAEPAPARVEPDKPGLIELAAKGKTGLTFKIIRDGGFKDAFKMKLLGLVDSAQVPELDVKAGASTASLEIDSAKLKLTAGEYGCILQGTAKMKMRRGLDDLQSAEVAAKQAALADDAAKKALADAQAALKAAADPAQKTEKQKAITEATAKQKAAAKTRADADKKVKDLSAKAAPKDATAVIYSTPLHLRIVAGK